MRRVVLASWLSAMPFRGRHWRSRLTGETTGARVRRILDHLGRDEEEVTWPEGAGEPHLSQHRHRDQRQQGRQRMATIRSRTYKVLKRWSTATSVVPISQTVCQLWVSGDRGDAFRCDARIRSVLIRMLKAEFEELQIVIQPRHLGGPRATIDRLVRTIASSLPSHGGVQEGAEDD